jgi:hypothetical protein
MSTYEYWISRRDILSDPLTILAFILLSVVVVVVAVTVYVLPPTPPLIRLLPIIIVAAAVAVFLSIFLSLPARMGFAIGDGKLVIDVGWFGVPTGKVYNISECKLEWFNASGTFIIRARRGGALFRAMGYGGARVVIGELTILPTGIIGPGMVVRSAKWILVARCPDKTYILAAPGLTPEVVQG